MNATTTASFTAQAMKVADAVPQTEPLRELGANGRGWEQPRPAANRSIRSIGWWKTRPA